MASSSLPLERSFEFYKIKSHTGLDVEGRAAGNWNYSDAASLQKFPHKQSSKNKNMAVAEKSICSAPFLKTLLQHTFS
jgi:hypothetical protein